MAIPSFSVEGQHVLISGGAGGIGSAFARAFLANGASVTVTDLLGCTGTAVAGVTAAPADTTLIQLSTCDPANVGTSVQVFPVSGGKSRDHARASVRSSFRPIQMRSCAGVRVRSAVAGWSAAACISARCRGNNGGSPRRNASARSSHSSAPR